MSKRSKALRYYRTSRPQGPIKKTFNFLFFLVAGVFILYQIVSAFALQSYSVDLPDMENAGILVSPLLYGPEIELINYRLPALRTPQRGELVLARLRKGENLRWYETLVNTFARFFTLNRISVFGNGSSQFGSDFQLVRVIGVPGDQVKLEGFRVQIKTRGKNVFLDEKEILQKEYVLALPEQADTTNPDLPFSGDQPVLSLQEDQYLLLRDDRAAAGAREGWGITNRKQIRSQVLFAFRPKLKRF